MAGALEQEHVHKVYSQIAEHFSDTRFKPWPRIAQFMQEQPVGSLIADVGCGNGKYLSVNPRSFALGSDICPELVAIAGRRGHEVAVCDCLHLPYRSNLFDGVICIAMVHHLSTEERRLAALKELTRVVKPGGRILVYVWAMEQQRKKFEHQDVMVPWHMQPKYFGEQCATRRKEKHRPKKMRQKQRNKEIKNVVSNDERPSCSAAVDEDENDNPLLGGLSQLSLTKEDFPPVREEVCIHGNTSSNRSVTATMIESRSEKLSGITQTDETGESEKEVIEMEPCSPPDYSSQLAAYTTFQRYYHVFKEGELGALFAKVGGIKVIDEFYDHENWCVLVQKMLCDTMYNGIARTC